MGHIDIQDGILAEGNTHKEIDPVLQLEILAIASIHRLERVELLHNHRLILGGDVGLQKSEAIRLIHLNVLVDLL